MAWPLVGREAELRFVAEALAEDEAGGVVVVGPPGVGKTRLAHEAAAHADASGCTVEWVRATRSAASIPLGAFAPLLPAVDFPKGVELLARARAALVARAGKRRLVLCVDDGQLLDDASAALVHQLAAAAEAFVLVTVRSGAAPDALRALWKDELCARLELGALARAEADALLAAGLGGPVDGATAEAVWALTRGNALFLRELVRHGLDRGLLAEDGGLWRWRGPVEGGPRLRELMDLRIDGLDAGARELLEVVAVGGPLEVALLPGTLEALERAELVERVADGRRRFVDVAHPLHGEAVRARLTPTRAGRDPGAARGRRGSGRCAPQRRPAARRDVAPRGRRHRRRRPVRARGRAGPGRARSGAGRAPGRRGAAGGRGLRRARWRTGARWPPWGAGRRPRRSWRGSRRTATTTVAAVALARARNLFWGLDRADDADAVLRDAADAVADAGLRSELAAQRVRLDAGRGRPQEALAGARPLLEDDAVPERARVTAALGAVEALFSSGRSEAAVALADRWLPVAERRRDELPHGEPVLLGMRAVALRLSGRLTEATTQSERAYALLLARRSAPGIAVEANSLGLIWLARGRVMTALRLCRESAALLRDADPVGMLAFALAGVGQAAAQAGHAEAARDAVVELERTPLGHEAWAPELDLARAWSAAAGGALAEARALAGAAAEGARSRGQDAYAVVALHAQCRLGDPAAAAPALGALAGGRRRALRGARPPPMPRRWRLATPRRCWPPPSASPSSTPCSSPSRRPTPQPRPTPKRGARPARAPPPPGPGCGWRAAKAPARRRCSPRPRPPT